jgi:nucleoside-diphosphate-sugar epimerase
MRRMRILVTGASGVLGRVTVPLLRDSGHHVATPSSSELDMFDGDRLRKAVRDTQAVLHLATRIPTPDRMKIPGAWDENDRLRAQATRLLVDSALVTEAELIVVPTVAFVYPPGPASESTPLAEVPVFCAPRWKLKASFAGSTTQDVAASHCALAPCMARTPHHPRPPSATSLTCTLKMRV